MQRNKAARWLFRTHPNPAQSLRWTTSKAGPDPFRHGLFEVDPKFRTTEYHNAQLQVLRLQKTITIDAGDGVSWIVSHAGTRCNLDTYLGHGSPDCGRRTWFRRRGTFDLEPFEEVSAPKVMEAHDNLVELHGIGYGEWERLYRRADHILGLRTEQLQFEEVIVFMHKKGITTFPASLKGHPYRHHYRKRSPDVWKALYSHRNSFHTQEVCPNKNSRRFVFHLDYWSDRSGSDDRNDGPVFYASRYAIMDILTPSPKSSEHAIGDEIKPRKYNNDLNNLCPKILFLGRDWTTWRRPYEGGARTQLRSRIDWPWKWQDCGAQIWHPLYSLALAKDAVALIGFREVPEGLRDRNEDWD